MAYFYAIMQPVMRIPNIAKPGLRQIRWFNNLLSSSHYVLLSLFFFAGLEVIFALHRWILLLLIIVLAVLLLGIILIRGEEKGAFHPSQTILPSMAAIGLTSFGLFLPATAWLHVYFAGCAILFFFILRHGAKQAYPTWNWVISLIVLFVSIASALGWRFHVYLPIIVILIIVFLIFALLSVQSLIRLRVSTSEATLLALCTAFVLTEVAWALQFLPLYYLVQTSVLVIFYYVIFHLVTISYEKSLKTRDIVEYIVVGTIGLTLILATANWI